MRAATVCVTAALTLGLAGLHLSARPQDKGKAASPHEEVVKGMLDTLETVIKVIGTIQDEASANAARPELKKGAARLLELRKRAETMRQPTKEEKERLEKEYQGKFEDALKRLRTETIRARTVPGGAEAVQEIAVATPKDKGKGKEKDKDKAKN
jgi:hypothetical protein